MGENLHLKFEGGSDEKQITVYSAKELDKRQKVPLVLTNKHITTPAIYLTYRKPEKTDVLVLYSLRGGVIELRSSAIPGEGETGSLQSNVSGRLVVNKDLIDLKINEGAKYNLTEMKDHLKLNRRFFHVQSEYAELLKNVMDFQGKVIAEVKAQSDNRGNAKASYELQTTTAFKNTFQIRIPLFDDYPPVVFTVELCYQLHHGGVIEFWLLSDDLQELIDEEREKIVKEELEKIKELGYLILQ
jgi:hypothetical protein